MSRDDKGLLQGRGATVHNAGPDNRMALELDGQSFQKSIALQGMDRRCGRLDRVILVVIEAERHGASRAKPGARTISRTVE